jgi:hypothetical protein
MARSNFPVSLQAAGGHLRLTGALAAATAIAATENPEELLNVAGFKTVSAKGKFSSVTANCVLALHPMTKDGETRISAGAPSTVNITGDGQFEIDYTLEGEQYLEVEVQAPAGKAATVDWIEVTGTRFGGGGSNEFADNLFRVQDDGDATKQLAFQLSGLTTGTTRTLTVPDSDGTLVVSPEFADNVFRVQDNGDATKEVALEASGITTGTTRTITVEDQDGYIGGKPVMELLPIVSGRWHFEGGPVDGQTVGGIANAAADALYAKPMWLKAGWRVNKFGFDRHAAGAGNAAKVALFSDAPSTGLPNARLAVTGELDLNGTGEVSESVAYDILTSGRYWVVSLFKAATGSLRSSNGNNATNWLGYDMTLRNPVVALKYATGVTYAGGIAATWPGSPEALLAASQIHSNVLLEIIPTP